MDTNDRHMSQLRTSIFDKAWERFSNEHQPGIIALLEEIEQQLDLKSGFLSLDELIIKKLQQLCYQISAPYTKEDMLNMTVNALSDIKIMDIRRNKLYGNFSDGYSIYKDNHDNIMYRMDQMVENDCMKLDLDSASSLHTKYYESDIDDTASLMACDSNWIERSPSILDCPVDDIDDFKLHKVLEDLRTRHVSIHLGFHDIDTKLAGIKEQNGKDLEFLDKLMANNELIRDRMHDMRTELNELTTALLVLKDVEDLGNLSPATTKKITNILVESDTDEQLTNKVDAVQLTPIRMADAILDLENGTIGEMEQMHTRIEERELSKKENRNETSNVMEIKTDEMGSRHEINILVKKDNVRKKKDRYMEHKDLKNELDTSQKKELIEPGMEVMHTKTNSFNLSIPVLFLILALMAYWKY